MTDTSATPATIVRDDGFHAEDFTGPFAEPGTPHARAIDLGPDADTAALRDRLEGVELIRIAFPSSADGRGFTLARRLRALGYRGRLRARGHVLSDQYAMARRSGFDEVEIDADLARRQPEEDWLFRADWRAHDYQSRLRG